MKISILRKSLPETGLDHFFLLPECAADQEQIEELISMGATCGYGRAPDSMKPIHASVPIREGVDRTEKERRIYYQNIVYAICNLIGRHDGREIVCGTIDAPSSETEDAVAGLITKIENLEPESRDVIK